MTKSQINLETMVRIDRTAGLVRNTVQQSFVRLQHCMLADSAPGFQEDRGQLGKPGMENFYASADAINDMAKQLLGNLFCMCELITQHSDPSPAVRARFAHILRRRPSVENRDVVDLHMRRLLRLPINEALEIVLGDLEASCNEINNRVYALIDRRAFETVTVS
jgi:hypothetical protein